MRRLLYLDSFFKIHKTTGKRISLRILKYSFTSEEEAVVKALIYRFLVETAVWVPLFSVVLYESITGIVVSPGVDTFN